MNGSRRFLGGVLRSCVVGACALAFLQAAPSKLGEGPRYLSQISTDKPIYRAGEKVYVRTVLLDALDRTPCKDPLPASMKILGPKGETVSTGFLQVQDSVGAFQWTVPEGQPGGEYTARVEYPHAGHPPAERKFDIRAYRAPRLKSQIEFTRKGYGPGDAVQAVLQTTRAEGGVPAGAKVTVLARVDGEEVYRGNAAVDGKGIVDARFDLPGAIERGEGTLAFLIEDGGVVETAAKTIPILLQAVDLEVYPEGGELVAGLPGRVYFEARTPAHKPADVAGVVVDGKGKTVAEFRSEHEGRGRFELTPTSGETYSLKILEPSGIRGAHPLPALMKSGGTLRSAKETYAAGEPVEFLCGVVLAEGEKPLRLSLCRREREVASAAVPAKEAGKGAKIALTPPETADGVLRATLYAGDVPLVERLIYRAPARQVRIAVTADKSKPVPGDRIELRLTATDERGKPVPDAVLGICVVDDSVLEMVDKREQAPRLPAMALLESEVKELGDAHIYLDPKNPKAPLATDLLLGTQGWRRFAFAPEKMEAFLEKEKDAARRVLANREEPQPQMDMMMAEGMGAPGGGMLRNHGMRMKGMPVPAARMEAMEKDAAAPPMAPEPALDLKHPAAPPAIQAQGKLVAQDAMKRQVAGAELRDEMGFARHMGSSYVRVYAHELRPGWKPGDRADFAETLYWNAALKTDKDGKATATFALSDAVTAFRVTADAFTASGALGSAEMTIESLRPFYIEPKFPLEVTAGDRVDLPVALVNGTEKPLDAKVVRIAHPSFSVSEDPLPGAQVKGDARGRVIFPLVAEPWNGEVEIALETQAGPYADRVARPVRIAPRGFPQSLHYAGILQPGQSVRHVVEIPKSISPGSLQAQGAVFPTPLGNLTQALQALIQEPYGCFEQASSTVYPMAMAQQYFTTHSGVEPALIAQCRQKLDSGYKRLAGYECPQKGYEWFGQNPGHEALTAYGLMEFSDLARVHEVDPKMVDRTRAWLMARRDGKGGFLRDAKALDSFGRAPQATTDAYITWALVQSGETGVEKEVAAAGKSGLETADSYVVALAADLLGRLGKTEAAKPLLAKLASRQAKEGFVDGAATSITSSGGEALKIETTALAITAWLPQEPFAGNVENAVRWLCSVCKAGRFGSTQSTVLALRAINAYDKARAKPKAPGSIRLSLDGQEIGTVSFDAQAEGALRLPDIAAKLVPGRHELALAMEGGSPMPYAFSADFHAETPASSEECPVRIRTSLTEKTAREGETLEAKIAVENVSGKEIPMAIAIVGLPGGLEPRHDQLKELVKKGAVDFYEVRGREVVLYWRGMPAGRKAEALVSLTAAVPGRYTGPASRAYLYYTDEYKQWAEGLQIEIAPK